VCVCVRSQAAYKDWLCASLLTGAVGDERSWQCRVYCDRVAQLCPYLLPQIEYSYVGEPAFSCAGMSTRSSPLSVARRETETDFTDIILATYT